VALTPRPPRPPPLQYAIRPAVDRKARLKIPPVPIVKQDPQERVHNWLEVFTGFDLTAAKVEAMRCIQCPIAPCIKACPVGNDIPGALWLLEQGDVIGAADKFRETSNMPDMCGRLCPQERLCEGDCVVNNPKTGILPVAIGKLEAFVADEQVRLMGIPKPTIPLATGHRVAIVGSGPAGLACAEELRKQGHAVTVFDQWPEPGGILRYGIPNFKLAKEVLMRLLEHLRAIGVDFVTNAHIGADRTVDDLLAEGYNAIFLGHGAPVGGTLGIQGERLRNVYQATEFLVRGNLSPAELPEQMRSPLRIGRRVAVVGAGDTAMDCVRTAIRLGAEEVTCLYRRTEAEMLGRQEERRHAREEGVHFEFLTVPVRLLGDDDGKVAALECVRLSLGEPDASGRPRPVPIPGSEFTIQADTVVLAIGYGPDPLIPNITPGLDTVRGGIIVVHPATGVTSRPGVFAGGDDARGADLVVTAVADGRRAAAAIHEYLASNEEIESA